MANIVSDISDSVKNMASEALQTISNSLPRRKVALITGITGQVNNYKIIKFYYICVFFSLKLGWELSY